MGRGSFEDEIRNKFEGERAAAPRSVWQGIESNLNSELIYTYQSNQSLYKWSAVAAIFIAISSLALSVNYSSLSENIGSSASDASSYNALLSDYKYGNQSNYPIASSRIILYPISIEQSSTSVEYKAPVVESSNTQNFGQTESLSFRRPALDRAISSIEIYPYHKGVYLRSSKKPETKNQMWAGIQAGAGNFNSSLSGSEGLSGSINPSNLASAVGTEAFVNPTTVVNPELSEGIATTLGIDFGMKVGKKWTIESGVSYTNVESKGSASINVIDIYSIESTEFTGIEEDRGLNSQPVSSANSRQASIQVEDSYEHEIDLKSNIQFTSIPLKAGYFIVDNKLSLRVNAGLAANYFVSSQVSDPSNGIISSYQNELYNSWSFDGIGGLELGYSIFDKLNFTIEPNYRHSISPVSGSLNSPSRFVVQTGLSYTLK